MKLNKPFRALIFVMLLISASLAIILNVGDAALDTYFYVDPSEVTNIMPPDEFSITINVTQAPSTCAWEISLKWDPTLLNISKVEEGDFLHRWQENPFPPPDYERQYTTSLAYENLTEVNKNLLGKIRVGCTLLPTTQPWANGTGWLCTLRFKVKALGSCVLNLIDTRLWDHAVGGYPASTTYPNNDSLFYNLPPPIHDIRISDATPLPFSTIRGSTLEINVTVINEGTETEPSVTINVKANDIIIGTTNLSLNGTGNSENRTHTYSMNWNTAGLAFGDYNITASVPAVTGEVDVADNLLIVGTVEVMLNDIAVTNVITNATTVRIGEIVSVNVTVANEGSETEAFGVAAYYNDFLIQSQVVPSLSPSSQTTLTFTWNTIFVSAGIYTIKANATSTTDTNTTNDEFTDDTVTVYRETGWPIANFTYSPLKPVINQTITFTSTSYDEDGYIASWAWDFNEDGHTDATTEIATWNYTVSGNYKIRLTVHDNDTLTPSIGIEKIITVYPRPIASFTYSPQNPLINKAVTFDASASYDPDGDIVNYSWDFGNDQTGSGKIVNNTYISFGTYTVTLNVTDDDGFTGTKSSQVRVTKAPIASFTFAPSSPLVSQTITFNASSSTPNGGSITKYSWDFGDDNFANETDPISSHVYTQAGTCAVTLTVFDNDSLTDTTTQSIIIGKLSSTISINTPPSSITKGESVTISGSIEPPRIAVTVTISYKLSTEQTWHSETDATDANSQYSFEWTPTTAGAYQVKTSWAGDTNTLGDESDSKTIVVQEAPTTPNILLYVIIAIIILIVAAAIVIYFLKFRKK